MRKYITIPDFRDLPSYQNVNARLLYLHCSMAMEVKSRTYIRSVRQLAADLDMSPRQVRTALDALERDGLIKTESVTHMVTRMLTHMVTQMVTQITIMSVSDLSTEASTDADTDADTHADTDADTVKNNKNNINHESSPLTSARVAWADMRGMLRKALDLDAATAAATVDLFKERQDMKGKTWKDEGDLKAHLIAWAEKRIASMPRQQKAARQTDAQAREAERLRAKEQQEGEEQKVKDWDEVQRVWRWMKEAQRKAERTKDEGERVKLQQLAASHESTYNRLRQQWTEKYQHNHQNE